MSYRSNSPRPPEDGLRDREERLRARWLETADFAEDARELGCCALMLLEELGVARNQLLVSAPQHEGAERASALFDLASPARSAPAWRETERHWLRRIEETEQDVTRLRAVYVELLDEYLSSLAHPANA